MSTAATSDLADRRLIFCINSGRSGSKYLAQLLNTARDVVSFHEAKPDMSGDPLRMINTLPLEATREARRIKAVAIAECLRSMRPHEIYAETNHMFIKTFFDVVLAEFSNVDVVILRRSLPHVVKSFIELCHFSPSSSGPSDWMSSPNAMTAALRPLGPDDQLDQYDAVIAYLLDIEARAQRFMQEYPLVRIHQVRLEHLLDREGVTAFLARLNLDPSDLTWGFVGQRVNHKSHRKRRFNNPTTLDECRRRLHAYLDRAEKAGIEVPRTAALD